MIEEHVGTVHIFDSYVLVELLGDNVIRRINLKDGRIKTNERVDEAIFDLFYKHLKLLYGRELLGDLFALGGADRDGGYYLVYFRSA